MKSYADREESMSKFVKILPVFAIVVASFVFVMVTTQINYKKDVNRDLINISEKTEIELNANLDSQISLALHMASSPLIKHYFVDPEDKQVRDLAFEELNSYQNSFLSKSIFWVNDVDLGFYSDCEFSYTVNPSDPNDYWYNMTMNQQEDYNFNVNYNPNLNAIQLWLNATVRDKNKSIGMAGTNIPLSDFINKAYENMGGDFNMYMYDSDTLVRGAKDHTLIEKNITMDKIYPNIPGKALKFDTIHTFSSSNAIYLIYPINKLGWGMIVEYPMNWQRFFGKTIYSVSILLILLVVYFVVQSAQKIMRPLKSVHATVDSLSTGNADLTRRITITEAGTISVIVTLVDSFNKFLQKLQDIISSVMQSKLMLVSSGQKLDASISNTASTIDAIGVSIEDISKSLVVQTESVDSTTTAVNEISSNIQSLSDMINTQTSGVSQASSAVEQMVVNIKSVNESVGKLNSSFSSLQSKANQGLIKQQDVNERIGKIREQSEMLQDANQIISSIAEQTNLLAMNAAIEAAHAGEAGKGFSVVADEIRKLSETSSTQSKTIGEQLKTIQDSIHSIVTVSNDSQKVFSEVADEMKSTDSLVSMINNAMEEQTQGSRQIYDALKMLKANTAEVKSASTEMTEESKIILDEVANLQSSTLKMKDGIGLMTQGADTINKAGKELNEISKLVNQSISQIGSQIDEFKV